MKKISNKNASGMFKNVFMHGAQKTEPPDVCKYKPRDRVYSAERQMSGFQRSPGRCLVIPIFVMNSGCPHRCIFCNQKITAGNFPPRITSNFFHAEVKTYLDRKNNQYSGVDIAFYGGSFTGIDKDYQETLLSWANSYVEDGKVNSIRVSTRPDCINEDTLSLLKKYNVSTVEIGAQSFNDKALRFAKRGHDAVATELAMKKLKNSAFRTGLHLMIGLPQDTPDGFMDSVSKTIELQPDTVRLHPVIVLGGTPLAEEYLQGNYKPLELAGAIDLCRLAWEKLTAAGIRVIRTGLQMTDAMEKQGALLAGPFHPAFGSMVMSSVFYNSTLKLLARIHQEAKELRFTVSSQDISNFRGMANMNITAIKKLYPRADFIVESNVSYRRGEITLATDSGKSLTVSIPGII